MSNKLTPFSFDEKEKTEFILDLISNSDLVGFLLINNLIKILIGYSISIVIIRLKINNIKYNPIEYIKILKWLILILKKKY